MNKNFALAALVLWPLLWASGAYAQNPVEVALPAGVIKPAFFDKQGIVVTDFKKGVAGLNVWQVQKGATKTVFYTSADNKVLMSGVLWDAGTGRNLSDAYITPQMAIGPAGLSSAAATPAGAVPGSAPTAINSLAISGVAQLAGIKEGKAPVERTLFIMFDPRCPYCHNVYRKTRDFVANGGTIKWIPTTILGDKANGSRLVADIMQASNPVRTMAEVFDKKAGASSPSAATSKAINENEAYFFAAFENNKGAGPMGVPVAFFQTANGPQMVSAIDDDVLLSRIFKDIKK